MSLYQLKAAVGGGCVLGKCVLFIYLFIIIIILKLDIMTD